MPCYWHENTRPVPTGSAPCSPLFVSNSSLRVILVEKPFPGRNDLYAGIKLCHVLCHIPANAATYWNDFRSNIAFATGRLDTSVPRSAFGRIVMSLPIVLSICVPFSGCVSRQQERHTRRNDYRSELSSRRSASSMETPTRREGKNWWGEASRRAADGGGAQDAQDVGFGEAPGLKG